MDTTDRRSRSHRRGQALSEYAMLVAIVGMGLVVILGLFGRATKQAWQHSENTFAQEPVASAGRGGRSGGGGGSGGTPLRSGVAGDAQPTPPVAPPKNSPDSSSSADSTGAEPDTVANHPAGSPAP